MSAVVQRRLRQHRRRNVEHEAPIRRSLCQSSGEISWPAGDFEQFCLHLIDAEPPPWAAA